MQIKFYLDKPKQATSPVILSVTFKSQRLRCGTGVVIPVVSWDSEKQRVRRGYTDSLHLNSSLDSLKNEVKKIYGSFELSGVEWNKETLADFKKRIDNYRTPEKEIKKIELPFFAALQYFNDNYITDDGIRPKDSTMKGYRALKKRLEQFEKETRYAVTFDSMTTEFYAKFVNWLYKKGLTDNAVGKHIKNLNVFLRNSFKKGYLKTPVQKEFKILERKAETIALTEDELSRIEKLDLTGNERLLNVRNIFLLQCYTGLRYSDLIELKPQNFDMQRGIIQLHMIKTKGALKVPITGKVKEIISHYPALDFPFISNQKMNEYIKELCKLAELNETVIITRYRGTERIDMAMPKHEAVGTHTARRTFITVSLKRGIMPELVMKISGHTDRAEFQKYVRVAEEMAFEEMNKAWK